MGTGIYTKASRESVERLARENKEVRKHENVLKFKDNIF
jgi:hypothetical protein